MLQVRLNKYLAGAGVASRRKADELIKLGQVKINGKTVTDLGIQVDPEKDKVEYHGTTIKPVTKSLLFMFNKPVGVTSTMADVHAEKTITDYFKKFGRVYPIGRLDKNSEGLILVTNNGDLANKLTHPKYEHEKEYEVVITRPVERAVRHSGEPLGRLQNRINQSTRSWIQPSPKGYGGLTQGQDDGRRVEYDDLEKEFSKRFILDGYKVKPMQVKSVKKISSNKWLIGLILQEGRKRQIRRITEMLDYKVVQLKRIRIGKLNLGNLPSGKYKEVNETDII